MPVIDHDTEKILEVKMITILTSCIPRNDIVEGTFNPEIFTASLDAVLKVYRGESAWLHSVYSQAEEFFRYATYPSQGLKTVVQDVFLRLSGVNTVPAIHRLETGFGAEIIYFLKVRIYIMESVMITSRITAKGQTLIPKKVRDFLNVDISDTICFTLLEDGKVLLTSETRSARQLFGLFKHKKRSQAASIEEMEAIIEARHKKRGSL